MQKQEKSRKPLIIGIVAAVVILAALLALLLTQCVGGQGETTVPTTTAPEEVPTYELYWNLDRAEYDGKSEAGMSSRMPEDDGYFHVRFFFEGEEITLKVADRKLINAIDVQDVMGLEFDDNGIVVGVLRLDELPLEKVGWQFYVQSAARTMIKLNSSESLNGMEVLLEDLDPSRIWDMTGKSGPIGSVAEAIEYDKVMAVQNMAGQVTHVFIFERPNYMMTHKGFCEHCQKEVDWYEFEKTDKIPDKTGHYQLQNDIQMKTTQIQPAEDTKLCLDLNGHRIDGKSGSRVYAMRNVGTTIAVMDTSEKQDGVIATHGKHDQGGPIWVTTGALYLYSGIIDGSDATSQKNGVTLSISNGAYFYMNGGKVIGGTATYTYNEQTGKYSAGYGGAIYCSGKMVMNDGIIEGGFAEGAAIYKDGKIDKHERGYGGNLFVSTSGIFEMNGGTIRNGKATSGGANIYADGKAEITINGGSILGGVVNGKGKNGGSVFLGSKTVVTINGGTITGGRSYNAGGIVYMNGTVTMTGGYIGGGKCFNFSTGKESKTSSSRNLFNVNGNLIMWGGTIEGGVAVTDTSATDSKTATVQLYGSAQITGGAGGVDLTVGNNNCKVIVGPLNDYAKIGVSTTKGLFSEVTLKDNLDNFYSNIEGAEIVYFEERLGLGRVSCICGKSQGETTSEEHNVGCEGKLLFWAPWTSTNSLPTTTGNYYLVKDVTTTTQTTILENNQDVKVDLNGKNITLKVSATATDGFRLYRCDQDSKLAITDTTDKPGTMKTVMPGEDAKYNGKAVKTKAVKDEDGKVITPAVYYTEEEMRAIWANGNTGMLLWARGGDISVHGGILDGSELSGNKNGMVAYAGSMSVTDEETGEKTNFYGQLNIYGGTIKCGYTKNTGNVFINTGCELNMYGGEITGGRANEGGNVYITNKAVFNMYGGTISDGLVDRTGEEVDGGQGGNIRVAGGAVMNLYGGTISGGKVSGGTKGGGHGGNIYVDGTLNAYGGEVTKGWANGIGGNIGTVSSYAKINLAGVKATDGDAVIGGNVGVIIRSINGLKITDGTVLSGGNARGGASYGGGGNLGIRMSSNSRDVDMNVVISDATITGGTSTHSKAANVLIENITTDKVDATTGKQTGYQININLEVSNSVIDGDFFVKATKPEMVNMTMSGKMVIGEGATTGLCLDSANPSFIALPEKLAAGSSILVEGAGFISGETAAENKGFFSSTVESVEYYQDRLFIGRMYCICGASIEGNDWAHEDYRCDGTIYGWAPWTSTAALPNTMGTADGRWYLTDDVQAGTQTQVFAGNNIMLDLNGKTIKSGNNSRAYALWEAGASLDITDTSKDETGAIVAVCNKAVTNQGFLWVRPDTELTLHRGTIDASAYMLKSNVSLISGKDPSNANSYENFKNGAAISGAKFTMNGGTIIGGTCYQVGVDAEGKVVEDDKVVLWVDGSAGGAVAVTNFDMYGGVIRDGISANVGGNVYVTGTFNMYGGEILGGSVNANKDLHGDLAYGGNVNATNMNMYGGRIAGGVAYSTGGGGNGGNVFVSSKFQGFGGTIEGGTATTAGNLGANGSGAAILLDGTNLIDGTASTGGNLGVNVRAIKSVTITEKTTISGGNATSGDGGNIRITSSASGGKGVTFPIVINGVIENGTASGVGGNIAINNPNPNSGYTHNTLVITMDGAVISGGTANTAGNIYIYNSVPKTAETDSITLTMNNVNVSDGTSRTGNGGNVYLYGVNGTTAITGSTFEGGSAVGGGESAGGNLWLNSVDAVITDSTITGGEAKLGGAIYTSNTATVTLDGVTVTGGEATKGGSICVNTATLNTTNTTITGGAAMTNGGNIHVAKGGTANLNAGTVVSNGVVEYVGGTETVRGGNICAYGKLNLDGATVYGGRATAYYVDKDTGRYGMGGNIFVGKEDTSSGTKAAVAIINNSQIYGGITESFKPGNKNTGFRPGANLYANDGATLTLDKGTVVTLDVVDGNTPDNSIYTTGNQTDKITKLNLLDCTMISNISKPNVYIENAQASINGATLIQNVATAHNLQTNSSGSHAAVVTMEAGSIQGGKVVVCDKDTFTVNGGQVDAQITFEAGKVGHLVLTGGTVNGGIEMIETATLTLSGAPTVTATNGGVNLNGNTMTVASALTGGQVYTSDRGYITGATVAGNEAYFASTHGYGVTLNDSKVFIGKVGCLCATPDAHTPGCIAAMTRILGAAYSADAVLAFLPVEDAAEVTTTGNWYLHDSISTDTSVAFVTPESDKAIVIDLNGKSINFNKQAGRMFTDVGGNVVGTTLVITDTTSNELKEQNGSFKIAAGDASDGSGGIRWFSGATGNADNQIYVLGGKLDASEYGMAKSGGGLFYLNHTGAKVYIYNGDLVGTAKLSASKGVCRGGAIYIYSGTVEMFDGIIRDGHAAASDTNGIWGGNIHLHDTNGTFIMRGGLITGGVLERKGSSTASMNGENLYVRNGTFEMYGGQIDGGVLISTSNAKITGNSIIKKGDKPVAYSLRINSGKVVDVSGLTGELVVTGTGKIGVNANETILGKVTAEETGKTTSLYGTDLYIGLDYCLCGYTKAGTTRTAHASWCDEKQLTWIPLSDIDITTDHNFYLASDVQFADQNAIKGGAKVNIDLNGNDLTVKAADNRLFRFFEGVTVGITDTSANDNNVGSGKMIGNGCTTQCGALLIGNAADTDPTLNVNLYSGTITVVEGKTATYGGILQVSRGTVFTMYGGTITGGNAKQYGGNVVVNSNGQFIMLDGTISNGKAGTNGGNIVVCESKASFVMKGGIVSGGMTTVSGYELGRGGNVYISAGSFRLEGGEIKDGIAQTDGGNIYSKVNFTMTGGTVSGGKANPDGIGVKTGSGSNADSSRGGNIWTDAGMKMEGGKVTEGQVFFNPNGGVYGGNIGFSGKLEITGGEITDGKANNGTGGNIASANSNSELIINNATVSGGKANSGGNICQNVRLGKSMTIGANAIIKDGEALVSNGGNIAVNSRANQNRGRTMNITINGSVCGGSAIGEGADIYMTRPHGTATYKEKVDGVEVVKNYAQDVLNVTISGKGGSTYIDGADTLSVTGETADIQVNRSNLSVSGKIDGGVTFADTASTITLTGAPVITAAGDGLTLNGQTIQVPAALTSGAEVYTTGTGYITDTTASGNEAYFKSIQGYEVGYDCAKVFIGKISCLCAMPEGKHTQGCIEAMKDLGLDAEAGDKIAMKPLTNGQTLVNNPSGFWYLPEDLTSTDLTTHVSVGSGKNLVLDLNGNTWNVVRGSRLFTTQNATDGGALVIFTDTSADESGKISLSSVNKNSNQGGILWLSGGKSTIGNTGYLLSGTLDASGYKFSSNEGAAICVASKNTNHFYMYGGTIIGVGESYEGFNSSGDGKAAPAANGGSVCVTYGLFEMFGGTIQGGHAGIKNPEYTVDGATDGKGGNIALTSGGSVIIHDGLITGGVASVGGNVVVIPNKDGVTGTFLMDGGEITGGVYVDSDKVTITGDAVISKGGVYSLKIADGRAINVEGLTGEIYVTAEVGQYFATGATIDQQDNGTVKSEVIKSGVTVPVTYTEGKLYMGVPGMYYCLCGSTTDTHIDGCNGTKYQWVLWTSTNTLPTESGNYRLAYPVVLEKVATPVAGAEIRIDLAGNDINLDGSESLYTFVADGNATVIITDSSKDADGQVILTGSAKRNGGMADINAGNTVELYRATLDASGFQTLENGPVFAVRTGGTLVIHSGIVKGGTAGSYNAETFARTAKNGGTFWVPGGNVTIKGGTIYGGTAYSAGGLAYISTKGTMKVEGGQLIGGNSWEGGGQLRAAAGTTLEITGGTLSGGATASTKKHTIDSKDVYELLSWNTSSASTCVFAQSNNDDLATVKISGGVVAGIYAQANGSKMLKIEVSGNPQIGKVYLTKTSNSTAYPAIDIVGALAEQNGVAPAIHVCEVKDRFIANGSEFTKDALQYITTGYADQTLIHVDAEQIANNPHVFTDADLNKIYSVSTSMYYCECGGKAEGMKDHTCENVIWTNWSNETAMPSTSGNYRLTKSVTLNTQWMPKISDVSVDLNGCNITCAGDRAIRWTDDTNGTLSITDSHEATEEKPVGKVSGGSTGQGGTLWVIRGTLNIYDGLFESSKPITNTGGGAVLYARAVTVNMYGGVIQEGHSTAASGGNIRLQDPAASDPKDTTIFNMYGGTIREGYAGSEELNTQKSNECSGANLYVGKKCVLNMYDGEILGGYTVCNYKYTDSNGKVQEAKKLKAAKNVYSTAASINCNGGSLNLFGGTIDGSVSLGDNTETVISGNTIISGTNGRGLSCGTTKASMTIKNLGENAKIKFYFPDSYFTKFDGVVWIEGEGLTDADVAKIYFSSSSYKAVLKDGDLYVEKK